MVGRLHIREERAGARGEAGRPVFNVIPQRGAARGPRQGGLFFINVAHIQVDGVGTFRAGVVDREEAAGGGVAVHVVERVVVGIADENAA